LSQKGKMLLDVYWITSKSFMNFKDHEEHVCEFQNCALWKIFGQCKSSGAHPSASHPLASACPHCCALVTPVPTCAEPRCCLEGASRPMEGSPPSSSLSFKAPRSFLALSSQLFMSKGSSGAMLGRLHHNNAVRQIGSKGACHFAGRQLSPELHLHVEPHRLVAITSHSTRTTSYISHRFTPLELHLAPSPCQHPVRTFAHPSSFPLCTGRDPSPKSSGCSSPVPISSSHSVSDLLTSHLLDSWHEARKC
jgi:hypothetical protein